GGSRQRAQSRLLLVLLPCEVAVGDLLVLLESGAGGSLGSHEIGGSSGSALGRFATVSSISLLPCLVAARDLDEDGFSASTA
ncbi:hypothetical protein TIFTF001_056872, partial [Ficus carica]